MSHSGQRVQQKMNQERLIFDENKNPVFTKPNDPNLIVNGGYDQADSQYGRYRYDHQAMNINMDQYGYEYQYSGNKHDHWAGDQYGGCGSYRLDNKGCGVNRCIHSNQRYNFYGNGSYINSKFFWTKHPKSNQFFGRGGMNVYNAGI